MAGLRAASHDVCVVLPADCPPDACQDAAVPTTGPLPGAFRRNVLPVLARRLRDRRLALHEALTELQVARVAVEPDVVLNVNTPQELDAARLLLRRHHCGQPEKRHAPP